MRLLHIDNATGLNEMATYIPKVKGTTENGFYALVVRVDADGQESVLHGYKGRHFSTRDAGIKSATQYIQSKVVRHDN